MPLPKVLWAALCGVIVIVVMLISAWAQSVTLHQEQNSTQIIALESHYAGMDQRLADIQQTLEGLRRKLDDSPIKH